MIRYAVQRTDTKLWRSARYSRSFSSWDSAQLWENAKTAQKEVRDWADNWVWSKPGSSDSVRVPAPVECIIVAVNIPEPNNV